MDIKETLRQTRKDYQRQLKNMRARLDRESGNNPSQTVASAVVRDAMQSRIDTLINRVTAAKKNEKLYG